MKTDFPARVIARGHSKLDLPKMITQETDIEYILDKSLKNNEI